MKKSIVTSSDNVFIDLGYSKDEAAIMQMRADLMADLRRFIKNKNLFQSLALRPMPPKTNFVMIFSI